MVSRLVRAKASFVQNSKESRISKIIDHMQIDSLIQHRSISSWFSSQISLVEPTISNKPQP
jgi:hypothetical protein